MWQVIGQARTVELLQKALERGSLAHAYLLVGPPHTGKMTLAITLAQALNCEADGAPCGKCASCQKIDAGKHADVQVIGLAQSGSPDEDRLKVEIGIDQIRQMQHSANLPPFEGKCKVFIINGAEFLSTEAANCLLKTLEEPVGNVVFILLATSDSLVPATVVSRCQRLELRPLPATQIESALGQRGVETAKARLLARLAHGGIGWAITAAADDSLLEQHGEKLDRLLSVMRGDCEERFAFAAQLAAQYSQNRAAVHEVLELWLEYWRDLLLVKLGCPDTVTNIDRMDALTGTVNRYTPGQIKAFIDSIRAAAKQLVLNANPRLALEVLMLDMPGTQAVRETSPRS